MANASRARIAVIGGVYANYLALESVIDDALERGATQLFCLGDLGAFGPHPDRVFPLLVDSRVETIQGNYDHSIGNRRKDCACGYTDPKDNHFARISYAYTYSRTSDRWKDWMRDLPPAIDMTLGRHRVHLCHGSPRQTNEFLWESTTPDPFLRRLLRDQDTDVIACTHTGIHWQRSVDDKLLVNVGVVGRPENEGRTDVSYCLLENDGDSLYARQIRVAYDYERLAAEMREEGLPEEFTETIETGWWKSCLEILPAKERARGKY